MSVLEGVISLSALLFFFALLISVVLRVFEVDSAERASRILARALALDPDADVCVALARSHGLPDATSCPSAWTIDTDFWLVPADLPDSPEIAFDPSTPLAPSGAGGLVLVRVHWSLSPIVPGAADTPAYASAAMRVEP